MVFPQWFAAFARYACAAVSCLLIDWDVVWLHIFTMLRLIEDERIWGEKHFGVQGSTFLMILYDELHRQSIAGRADSGDETLSLVKAFRRVDQETLSLARSKLADVLASAGINAKRAEV